MSASRENFVPRQAHLASPAQVRQLLAALDFHPSRKMGQNFLIDGNTLRIILQAADVPRDGTVLEIGPGLGVLTEALLGQAGHVLAVEKDARLLAYLADRFRDDPCLTLIHADALDPAWHPQWPAARRRVVANLPYSIASRLLVQFTELAAPPVHMVMMVQEDVARRILAEPGAREYGLLSILLRASYDIRLVKVVPAGCFLPAPEISSAVISCTLRAEPAIPIDARPLWNDLLHFCFTRRRKQMASLLRDAPVLRGFPPGRALQALAFCGLASQARPEDISVAQWGRLAALLAGGTAHETT